MSSPHFSNNITTLENTFHQAFLGEDFGKNASQRRSLPDTRVQLFISHRSTETTIGTAAVCRGVGRSGLFFLRRLYIHDFIQDDSTNPTVIIGVRIMPQQGRNNYPYVFEMTGEFPETLSALHVSGINGWDTKEVLSLSDVQRTLIDIDPLEDDYDFLGLALDINATEVAVGMPLIPSRLLRLMLVLMEKYRVWDFRKATQVLTLLAPITRRVFSPSQMNHDRSKLDSTSW